VQVFNRTFRFSRRLELANVFEQVTKVHHPKDSRHPKYQ
jgi:hypothetical protein